MLNFQAARVLHRHENEWVELTPIAGHSPDPRDPERQLVHGAQVFRCTDCDAEFLVEPREPVD